MLFGSSESNSMFGHSIASAGDLDQDGFQGFYYFTKLRKEIKRCEIND